MEDFQSQKNLLLLPLIAKFPFPRLPTDNASSPAAYKCSLSLPDLRFPFTVLFSIYI